ncbi:MAG: ATP-binding cassette domain-containing protein [Deltaproteobacteria bacterium]|nr:ATP-binding cassette domain-containing protein [Deltaproteobacteria bacterium]
MNPSASPAFVIREKAVQPSIEMKGINYAFGEGESRKQVLFDNRLQVFPGEIVILTGPSGSGKTTLLTLIGALRSIQEGSMKVLGHDLGGMSARGLQEVRTNIGFIFQAHNLFESLTAFQTLALAMQLYPYSGKELKERPAAILTELGLKDRMHYKPEKLSGGQQQRVAIGRALVNHPKLILADEPTAALDKDTGRQVVQILQKRAKEEDCTIMIVTHDNRILDAADRILKMVDRYIVSDVVVSDSIVIGEFLRKSRVFKDVSPTVLAGAAKEMKLVTYSAGDFVIQQGERGDKFFLIRAGTVEILKDTKGQLRSVGTLGPGDFFGELALLRDEPRAATIKALEPLEVFILPKDKFDEVVHSSTSFGEQLKKEYFT